MGVRGSWGQWAALVAVVSAGSVPALGQAPSSRMPLVAGAYAQGSFIIPHSPAIRHLAVSHPTGLELNLQRQTNGAEPWHAWYRYPKVGLALVYYDYHNPLLGKSFAASAYISKSFWRTRRQELSFRMGGGLAYFPVHNDVEQYKDNVIVSSPINATLQARLEYDLALTEHLGLLLGLGLNHYSNGATTKPNLGMNLPTLVLGLNYHQQRPFRPLSPAPPPEPTDIGRTFFTLSSSVGWKQFGERQRYQNNNRRYLVNSLTLAAGRRLNRKSVLVAGVEGFYDRSLLAQLRQDSVGVPEQNLPDVKKAGVYLGHELLFGRLAFVSHLGVYFYNPYKSNNFYYERLGLKYHFTNRVFGNVDLKVHRGAADVIEWRLGVKL